MQEQFGPLRALQHPPRRITSINAMANKGVVQVGKSGPIDGTGLALRDYRGDKHIRVAQFTDATSEISCTFFKVTQGRACYVGSKRTQGRTQPAQADSQLVRGFGIVGLEQGLAIDHYLPGRRLKDGSKSFCAFVLPANV